MALRNIRILGDEILKKQAKLYSKSAKVKMLKYTQLINGNIKKVSATIIHF